MLLMLTDDLVIYVFPSTASPPDWIEAIDIENREYSFCDETGQIYEGRITSPIGVFSTGAFRLVPVGEPDKKNALDLIGRAVALDPNSHFESLRALRENLLSK